VREHERRGLRVLAAQRGRELLRVGLAQAVQPGGVGELRGDAAQDRVGLRASRRPRSSTSRANSRPPVVSDSTPSVASRYSASTVSVVAGSMRSICAISYVSCSVSSAVSGPVILAAASGPTAMQTMAIFWRPLSGRTEGGSAVGMWEPRRQSCLSQARTTRVAASGR
jgi:hypothetical protein